MTTRTKAACILVLAALSACVKFPDPPPDWPGGAFTVDVMLKRAREAVGGAERVSASLRETRDFVASIEVRRPSAEGETATQMAVKWRRGGDWAIDVLSGPEGRLRYAGRGGLGVEVRDGEIVREGVTADEVGVERLLRSLFVLDFFESGGGTDPTVEKIRPRDDGGHDILLTKWDARGMKFTLALDSVTCEPRWMREWVRVGEEDARALDTFFAQFGPDREGHEIPRLLRTYAGDRLIQETRIRDVVWNQGLRDADFLPWTRS